MPDAARARDLFLAALDLPHERRPAFVAAACGPDADLRAEVERLLAADADPATVLEAPPVAGTGTFAPDADPTAAPDARPADVEGLVLGGRYKLVEPIGEGGMGAVWMAAQTEPIRRAVAVKLIKAGMDSKAVLARFEAERQALALMDHPNIAKVLDAGATPDGRPFFVMELVKGVPITQFCDGRRLTPAQRLELFVPVCQAIQHAHQKGIIHRDIKPNNVLVCQFDDKPVPKVIDFGVAKAAGPSLTDQTLMTGFGAVVGTPEYMSPEQASFNQLDVDTRSDVYALGVLLYELLTGSPPFPRRELETAGLLEILRVIREQEPPRPSTRLSSPGTPAGVAAARGTEPRRLAGLVRGELDWIVMKALEKDRGRRYDTANGLAADVQRYLTGDAVAACPPTVGYRVRKFVRRHRGPVIAAAVLLAALVAGIVGTTWGLVRAERERARVVEEERKVRDLLADAEQTRRAAELRAASAAVDLDLKYLEHGDHPTGLLRLARTLGELPPDARELREFVAAAIVAHGQQLAPLLPPLRVPGEETAGVGLVPDGRTVLTRGTAARLWDTRTGRLTGILREGAETTVETVLSEDGRVAATVAADGVVRFWAVPAGRLLARTPPLTPGFGTRPDEAPDGMLDANWFLLSPDGRRFASGVSVGPAERSWEVAVWDTATGRRVSRLPRFAGTAGVVTALSPDARRLVTARPGEPIRVWSADDGGLLRSVPADGLKDPQAVAFSPSGRRAVVTDGFEVRFFDAGPWARETVMLLPGGNGKTPLTVADVWGVTDDAFAMQVSGGGGGSVSGGVEDGGRRWTVVGPQLVRGVVRADGEVLAIHDDVRDFVGAHTLYPPAGRPFHPALGRFAVAGRWLPGGWGSVADLAAGKPITPTADDPAVHVPGVGFVYTRSAASLPEEDVLTHTVAWTPLPGRLPPDDLLTLWAQVVAKGELGPGDELTEWDGPTWERKRQELAARPVPFADFPFPGRVAADRLYWLRTRFQKYVTAENGQALLRRAEEVGDADEVAYWRPLVAKLSRESKP